MRAERRRFGDFGRLAFAVSIAASLGGAADGCSGAGSADPSTMPETIRIATFNVRELSTEKLETTAPDGSGGDPQLLAAAEIVRRVDPDVLVLQEIDHDYRQPDDLALNARRFASAYLSGGGDGGEDPGYAHLYAAPCNTGIPSGHDLDDDGEASGADDVGDRGYGEDCFGFGHYPGQYAMAVLSRFPIDAGGVRTFQRFPWRELPGHHIPPDHYEEDELAVLRLSSKSHWDLPIRIGDGVLHLWVSHPTPPVFDGAEDRNGRRNFDEIAFWVAYLEGAPELVDDRGRRGGFEGDAPFVIAGDLNADPRGDNAFYDGRQSVTLLLEHPGIRDTGDLCTSRGGAQAGAGGGEAAARATAVFDDGMRLDYLLPSAGLAVAGGGVFWPAPDEDPEGARFAEEASDHRLVWIDVERASL